MSDTETAVLTTLTGIGKRFAAGSDREVVALQGVTLTCRAAEWTYIVGGNGSGKSTLLRIISGELTPDEGSVEHLPEVQTRGIVYVEQGAAPNLVLTMTVYENLVISALRNRGRFPGLQQYRRSDLRARFSDVLAQFGMGIENRLEDQVGLLSGGQQQAVVAAQVLLLKPSLILLDEFTSALDKRTAPVILSILQQTARSVGAAIVAVTHDFHWIESTGDRVVVMDGGRIKSVLHRTEHALTAQHVMEASYGA
jgi:putative ABC transport system ATP-binding protein